MNDTKVSFAVSKNFALINLKFKEDPKNSMYHKYYDGKTGNLLMIHYTKNKLRFGQIITVNDPNKGSYGRDKLVWWLWD